MPRGLAAFRHRNYRLFFGGQFVSLTGTWMQTLAQAWLVLTLTSSAFKLGLVNVFQFAPLLLFGLVAGVVADRFPKRSILLVTQSIAATLAATLALLAATDRVELWHVYLLALGLGLVNAFDMPTRQAFVGEMVGQDDLVNAVALNSALFNAARIIGPALAGLLLAVAGPAVCFALNAASYLAVIAGLALMRVERLRPGATRGGIAQLREGLAYVRASRDVLLPLTLVGFVATFGMNFQVWIPLLAKNEFDTGAGQFGGLMSALGIGSLSGALALAFLGRRPHRGIMVGTAAALGAFELALAWAAAMPTPLLVALALLPWLGFAMTTTTAMANSAVQTSTPEALRGRVMSVYMTVFGGTAPFGALLAGSTAGWLGTPASLALGGSVTLAAAGAITWISRVRPAPAGRSAAGAGSGALDRSPLSAGAKD